MEHEVEESEQELRQARAVYEELEDKLKSEEKEVVQINQMYHVLHRKSSI